MKFVCKFVFLFFAVLTLCSWAQGQSAIVMGRLNTGFPRNLTKMFETECKHSYTAKLDDGLTLEVKSDTNSRDFAKKVLEKLKPVISLTGQMLKREAPLKIVIYVAKFDRLPESYQVTAPTGADFVYPIVNDRSEEIDLSCVRVTKHCETIYTNIPHELTHRINDGLFLEGATWISEGFAEYVSSEVGHTFSPPQSIKRQMETLPEISLNYNPIRANLLSWTYSPATFNAESVLYYGASHQLLREILTKAKKRGKPDAFKTLLAAIRRQNRSLSSNDIVTLIRNEVGIDVGKLGRLDERRKLEIFEQAKDLYLRERRSNKGPKYSALATFAYLDLALTDDFLSFLLEEVFNKNNNSLFQHLSVKALTSRLELNDFNRLASSTTLGSSHLKKFRTFGAFKTYLKACCEN